jgi:hypothetical protein
MGFLRGGSSIAIMAFRLWGMRRDWVWMEAGTAHTSVGLWCRVRDRAPRNGFFFMGLWCPYYRGGDPDDLDSDGSPNPRDSPPQTPTSPTTD